MLVYISLIGVFYITIVVHHDPLWLIFWVALVLVDDNNCYLFCDFTLIFRLLRKFSVLCPICWSELYRHTENQTLEMVPITKRIFSKIIIVGKNHCIVQQDIAYEKSGMALI